MCVWSALDIAKIRRCLEQQVGKIVFILYLSLSFSLRTALARFRQAQLEDGKVKVRSGTFLHNGRVLIHINCVHVQFSIKPQIFFF